MILCLVIVRHIYGLWLWERLSRHRGTAESWA